MDVLIGHHAPPVVDGMVAELADRFPGRDVAGATTYRDVVETAAGRRPAVVVLEQGLDGIDVGDACAAVLGLGCAPVVLVPAGSDPLAVLEAGALAIVVPTDGVAGVAEAVEQALAGHAFVPGHLLGGVLRGLIERRRDAEADGPLASLTPREAEVLDQLSRGADDRAIAARLSISPATAKTHVGRVLKKLEVRSRAEAVALLAAERRGGSVR